jgi:hypothetical protein
MAFASGKQTADSAPIKRYIGVASSFVLAVNPNKAKLSEIYGRDITEEPTYIGKDTTLNVDNIRIDFILKTDPKSNNGIETISKLSYYLSNSVRYNRDKTKVQVIDKYGRTAWATIEEAKNHTVPQYSKGPANIDSEFRPAFVGEENLVNFLINYLGIPSTVKRNSDNSYSPKTGAELAECEAGLENISEYFKGNIQELVDIVNLQPNNKAQFLYGVKTTEKGQYQDVFKEMVLKNNVYDWSKLTAALEERKAAGAYPNTVFDICSLKEYEVEADTFENPPLTAHDDLPW